MPSFSTRSLMFLKLSDLALLQMLAVVLAVELGARGEEEEGDGGHSWPRGCRLARLWDLDIGLLEDTAGWPETSQKVFLTEDRREERLTAGRTGRGESWWCRGPERIYPAQAWRLQPVHWPGPPSLLISDLALPFQSGEPIDDFPWCLGLREGEGSWYFWSWWKGKNAADSILLQRKRLKYVWAMQLHG